MSQPRYRMRDYIVVKDNKENGVLLMNTLKDEIFRVTGDMAELCKIFVLSPHEKGWTKAELQDELCKVSSHFKKNKQPSASISEAIDYAIATDWIDENK